MCWVALRAELTRMANELSQCGEPFPPMWWVSPDQVRHHHERVQLRLWELEYAKVKADRRSKREKRLAERPPCPHCGKPVERDSKRGTAKLPKYCSDKCKRAATFAKWYAKHGQERNERRRAS